MLQDATGVLAFCYTTEEYSILSSRSALTKRDSTLKSFNIVFKRRAKLIQKKKRKKENKTKKKKNGITNLVLMLGARVDYITTQASSRNI